MALINIFFWTVLALAAISFSALFYHYEKSKQQAMAELERIYRHELNGYRNTRHQYRSQFVHQHNYHNGGYKPLNNQINTQLNSRAESITRLHIQKHKTRIKVRNATHSFRKIQVAGDSSYNVQLGRAM